MAHLIDKDALIAWAKETYLCENASMIRKVCYKQLLEHLDTLEVKEVDLDEEIEKCLKQYHMIAVGKEEFEPIAKHFFELGIAVSNKAQKGE